MWRQMETPPQRQRHKQGSGTHTITVRVNQFERVHPALPSLALQMLAWFHSSTIITTSLRVCVCARAHTHTRTYTNKQVHARTRTHKTKQRRKKPPTHQHTSTTTPTHTSTPAPQPPHHPPTHHHELFADQVEQLDLLFQPGVQLPFAASLLPRGIHHLCSHPACSHPIVIE